jgi:uncharacterized HAD superfamily protein
MFFAVDIDGTIATYRGTTAYAPYLNRVLSLDLPERMEDGSGAAYALAAAERIYAYVEASPEHKTRYQAAVHEAQFAADVQEQAIPIAGAVEGMRRLATLGQLFYVTCRKQETYAVTQAWLARYGFPQADHLTCCETYYHKYITAYQHAGKREPIIVIDDRVRDMVLSFRGLVDTQRDIAATICKRIALVAFGHEQLPKLPSRLPFPVVPLLSWEQSAMQQLIDFNER